MTFARLQRMVVMCTVVAAGLLAVHVAALPTSQAHRMHLAHKRHFDARAEHDDLEAQVHALEAALQHYAEYGDQQSLQTYLDGIGHGSNASEKPAPAQDVSQGKPQAGQPQPKQNAGEDCEDQANVPPKKEPKKATKRPGNDQPQTQPHLQPKPKPQPQAQAQPQPQPQPEPKPKSSGQSQDNGSIDGYTPPSFATSEAPSTTSLYRSVPFKGKATFYNTGMGACGVTNCDNDPIVAVSKDVFEQYNPSSGNPNHNSLCGRRIEISWNGKTAHAFAMDECPTCDDHSLDLSPQVFDKLDLRDKGVLDGISWRFI